jgi:hypothetical protein
MTIENDVLRDDLSAWNKSREIALPEYSADPQVQCRVGNIIANGAAAGLACKERSPPFGRTHDRQLSGTRCIP